MRSAAIFRSTKKLILASGSPRRQDFLSELGLDFQVDCAEIDETPAEGESAVAYVRRLAVAKAEAVAQHHSGAVVIGADTAVVCQSEILGKPVDGNHHLQMLQKLGQGSHEVITGFAVVGSGETLVEEVCSTVCFHPFTDEILKAYVASGDGSDKAGGYGLQSAGAFLVQRITGSHSNVIGFPMTELVSTLLKVGVIVPGYTS